MTSKRLGLEDFRQAMTGMQVSRIWRGHGSAIFVEFGALTPTTRRDGSAAEGAGEIGLMIEWSWRIEEGPSVLCGSWSDEAHWRVAFKRLIGREVVDVAVFGRLPEVAIALSGDLHLASFMTADGDPQWALFDRRGSAVVTLHCRRGEVQVEQ